MTDALLALALALAVPVPVVTPDPPVSLDYADAYRESVKSGKPLAIYVGARPRYVPDCVVTTRESLPKVKAPAVAIGVPYGDQVVWLPGDELPAGEDLTVRQVHAAVRAVRETFHPAAARPAQAPGTVQTVPPRVSYYRVSYYQGGHYPSYRSAAFAGC